jgi:hypothetical protein
MRRAIAEASVEARARPPAPTSVLTVLEARTELLLATVPPDEQEIISTRVARAGFQSHANASEP